MDPDILASQKRQEMLAAFWPRKVSCQLTKVLVRTPITPNQTTVVWGIISVLNSYTVYAALTGSWWAIPLIPIVYQFCFILDCVDGEIARFKQMANPIGGKLLDGVCHRATEFTLLATFALAAHAKGVSWLALPVGLLLLSGDAMYVFVYERRLTTLRLEAGFRGHIRTSAQGTYLRGTPWSQLSRHQRVQTITGLFHYKSVYAVVAVSYLPASMFLAGLAALSVYKHYKWMRLLHRTLSDVGGTAVTAVDAQRSSTPAGHMAVEVGSPAQNAGH